MTTNKKITEIISPEEEYILDEKFFDDLSLFLVENKEILEDYNNEFENLKNIQLKYFEKKLEELKREVTEDSDISDEDLEKAFFEKVKKLEDQTKRFFEKDIQIFLESKKIFK